MRVKVLLIGAEGKIETANPKFSDFLLSDVQTDILRIIKLSRSNLVSIYDLKKMLSLPYSTIHKSVSELITYGILSTQKKENNGRMSVFLKISPEINVMLASEALQDRLVNWEDYKKTVELELEESTKNEELMLKKIRELK